MSSLVASKCKQGAKRTKGESPAERECSCVRQLEVTGSLRFNAVKMFLILLVVLVTAAIYFVKRHYSQWQRLGFPSEEPEIPYGSLGPSARQQRAFGLVISDIYNRFQDRIVGLYLFFKPTVLIRDAHLARQIMTSDFNSFHDRGVYVDEKNDPLSANLFNLEGSTWRALRMKLTPSFSSGKLKGMFDTVDDVADKLIAHIDKQLEDGKPHTLEFKNLMTTYAVDIIGSVIFGLELDSFVKPNNEFRVLSSTFFQTKNVLHKIRNFMNFVYPPIARMMARLGINSSIFERLREIVQRTIEHREKNGVIRKDLLQLLIQLKNTGKISDDNDQNWKVESVADNLKSMSIDMIAANAFIFYVAGSETTAATTSLTLYELAMNPELLKKVQQEIDECLQRHNIKPNGRLTYDAVQEMKFLSLCVMETTRKYPGLPVLNRICTQDYQVPDSKYTIKKGTSVIISLLGIHRDEKYFPDPMDYKPERFSEESKDYDPVAFMPFGEGPRHCIAQRMGVVNVKVALAKILANFNIEPQPRKEVEFMFHTAPVLMPKNGLPVTLSRRW